MVRRPRAGRAGTPAPPAPELTSACPSAADGPDDARAGAGAGARARARVAAALVGGRDPRQLPDVVAGGRRGRERRAPGRPGGTAVRGEAAGRDARPASGRAGPRFPFHPAVPPPPVLNASLSRSETHPGRARACPAGRLLAGPGGALGRPPRGHP